MAKKRRKNPNKSKNQPTTNPFWSKITTPKQINRNVVNMTPTKSENSNSEQSINSKHYQCGSTVESNKPDNILDEEQEFTKDLSDNTTDNQIAVNPGIQQKHSTIQMKLIETGSNNSQKNAGNMTTQQAVSQGLASNIKLAVNDSSKAVKKATLQSNKGRGPITYNETHGAKPIQSRITRASNDGISIVEEKKNLFYLSKQSMEGKPQPQEVISETQDIKPQPQVKQKSTTSLRNDIPAQFLPSHYMCNYPKGIPRSFLVKPSSQTPEPYSHFVNKNANPYQQNVQPNTSHLNWQTGNVPMETEPVWHPNTVSAAPAYGNMGNVEGNLGVQQPMFDQTFDEGENRQVYSPSDVYADNLASNSQNDIYNDMEPDSPEHNSGQKRQSAFDRLGPVSEPKKPKLTINLLFNKEQAVREVVDGATEETKVEKYVPVHLRKEIIDSTDETVVKFRDLWPWRRSVPVTKSVTARTSKMAMILEMEQMDEFYVRENLFFLISVKGYPPSWTKEKVLDVMLDTVKTKGFIPCFIEFTAEECKFLVIKCRPGIMVIHKNGFYIRKDDVEMVVTISVTATSLNHIEFIPRLILRKRLVLAYDGTNCLDLSNFTTKEDISHFLYYPLNQQINQIELMELQTSINWEKITELNLSHNRLTSIDGFNLAVTTPKLKHLDLSHNYLDNVMKLLQIRDLGLRSIKLDGNPLCINYIDPDQYVKVLKTMFSSLQEIDGIPIKFKGDMPPFKKNYCPEAAKPIIEKFLETYFPLLDSTDIESRAGVEELYHDRASMTITYRFKIRYGPIYRSFRSLFQRSRVIDEGDTESVDGAAVIADLIDKWPPLKHDPTTFSVDVIKHDDFMTIFKVAGIVKLTSESLADEEHLLAFTRTFVLHSYDGCEFKITNDMVYWDIPTNEYANNAFQITTTVKPMKLNLALESEPDDNLKENLMKIFMQLTDLGKEASERCLDLKNWNLKLALDYFIKLLKLDDLETLTKEGIS